MIEAPLRRREIVAILYSANGKVKINDLAARFGVGRRTIRRDVEKLSLIYPIASQTGRHGGVYINHRFDLLRDIFTQRKPKR